MQLHALQWYFIVCTHHSWPQFAHAKIVVWIDEVHHAWAAIIQAGEVTAPVVQSCIWQHTSVPDNAIKSCGELFTRKKKTVAFSDLLHCTM